ncbi:SWIM zinc finger domain-containing protein [Pseudoroseomonas wenyumeiae]
MGAAKGGKRQMQARFEPAVLRDMAGDAVFQRGEEYVRSGRVEILSDDGNDLRARVVGTEIYRARMRGRGGNFAGECSCPAFADHSFCKHLVATALFANAVRDGDEAVPDRIGAIRAHLLAQGVEQLAEMILGLAERDPVLFDRLDLAASAASGDPAEAAGRCRAALKRVLRTSRFVEYGEAGAWTQGVIDVLDQLAGLISPGRADLVLEMIDELFRRLPRALENVDDSDGGGSEIVARAAELHLAACEAARPEPIALARELFRLETTEEFGAFQGASDRYGHLLGPAGLDEYGRLAQAAWDRLPKNGQRPGRAVVGEDGLARYRLFPILDRLAEREGDVDRRIALRKAHLVHAQDYLRLAEFCLEQGREAEAIQRAEEGAWLFDDTSGEALLLFLAEQHRFAGRMTEAEAVLWPAFERSPSLRLYEAMVEGKKPRSTIRAALAGRAVELLEARLGRPKAGTQLFSGHLAGLLVEILLRERRLAAAWAAARHHGCPEGTWLALAQASEGSLPGEALTVYERQAEQQVGLTNKHGYAAACRLITRMAALRARLGDQAAHQAYVEALLARHRAKRSFVAMLRGGRIQCLALNRLNGGLSGTANLHSLGSGLE